MNNNFNESNTPNAATGIEINFGYFFNVIMKKWWALLISAIIVSGICVVAEKTFRKDTYTSECSFITNNKSQSVEQAVSNSDVSASITMANTLKYILKGRSLLTKVLEGIDSNNISLGTLEKCIKVEHITDTCIIELSVTTRTAELSEKIAKLIVANYKPIVEKKYPDSVLTVCDDPSKPTVPDKDTSTVIVGGIGAIIGILIVFVWLIIRDLSDDTVKSAEDITERLDLNVMGAVSFVNKDKNKTEDGKEQKLLISEKTASFSFVETYKAIRTKIETLAGKKSYKTFFVTSTAENEGKTTVATNIAVALAKNGKSVLLIDADLRKPAIANMLDMSEKRNCGLADIINGNKSLSDCVTYIDKYKFYMIACSKSTREPTELLSAPKMESFLEEAEKEFDYIIIDTPPAGLVADASIIARYSDAGIFVIRENGVGMEQIALAVSDIVEAGTPIAGCVYNCVDTSSGKAYGRSKYKRRYGYGYGYRYGYGYGRYGYGYGKYGYGYGSYGYGNNDRDDN